MISGNPLQSPCDASITSPILQSGEQRGSERVSYLPKFTQLVSVGVWILTQLGLFSKALFHSSTVFVSDGQKFKARGWRDSS